MENRVIFKVNKGQNPYYVIERYIYEHTEVIEDMIAVLEIDGVRTNELLEVDAWEHDGWIWLNDCWEGEPEIALIDFFPVSEACNLKNAVPIDWIGDWLSDRPALERTATEMNLRLLITDWQSKMEKQND